jgi:hypothetical protein
MATTELNGHNRENVDDARNSDDEDSDSEAAVPAKAKNGGFRTDGEPEYKPRKVGGRCS